MIIKGPAAFVAGLFFIYRIILPAIHIINTNVYKSALMFI
jgi:hypothetical protein